MDKITVKLPNPLLKLRPAKVLSRLVSAFSSYVSHGIALVNPEIRENHLSEVGYLQHLTYELLSSCVKGNKFKEDVEIPFQSKFRFLIVDNGLAQSLRIINKAWDCYLFDNHAVFYTGEVFDLLDFMTLRDIIGRILIEYRNQYDFIALTTADTAQQEPES